MLPMLINYEVIRHTLTYWEVILSMIIAIHITYSPTYPSVNAVSNNNVVRSYYSAHQAVSKFAEHHIDMISCVHRKWQTRACVSEDINKSFECVTITDSKFSSRVLERTPKRAFVNRLTISQYNIIRFFASVGTKENFLICMLPTAFCLLNCFLISLSSRHFAVMTCAIITKLLDTAKFLISEPDASWYSIVNKLIVYRTAEELNFLLNIKWKDCLLCRKKLQLQWCTNSCSKRFVGNGPIDLT